MAVLPFRRLLTNRAAAEARAHLRATLDASPAPMLLLSPELRVVQANHALCQTLGEEALAREIEARSEQLSSELLRAGSVQRLLLPSAAPLIPGFAFAVHYLPAQAVSGDFYDWWQPRPGLLNLVLGDVSGKGAAAAVLMASVRSVLRATAGEARPAEALRRAAPFLTETLGAMGAFVTLFFAQLDIATCRLRFVDAGHGLAIVRRGGRARPAGGPRSLPIGIDPDDVYVESFVDLTPGDAVVAFTDGLLETGAANACRTVEDLAALVPPDGDATAIARELINVHAGLAASDDTAILVLEATSDSCAVAPCQA